MIKGLRDKWTVSKLVLFLFLLALTVLIFTDIPSSLFKKAISEWIEKQWSIKADIKKVRPTFEPSLQMEDVTITPTIPPLLKGGEEGLESGLSPEYKGFSIRLRRVNIYPVWFSLLSGRFTWRFTSTTKSNGGINGVVSESVILDWKDLTTADFEIKAIPLILPDGARISGNASIKMLEESNRDTAPKTLEISIFGLPTGNTSFRLNHPNIEGKVTVFIKTL